MGEGFGGVGRVDSPVVSVVFGVGRSGRMEDTTLSFAKQPTQPPQFDAGAFAHHAALTAADIRNFQSWKRWAGGELEYDGIGLRDVVNANALALNQIKAELDALVQKVNNLPSGGGVTVSPFPQASGPRKASVSTGGAQLMWLNGLNAKVLAGYWYRVRSWLLSLWTS